MTTKEELWEQRQPVDHKGRKIVVSHQGPNRAERRRAQAKRRREEKAKAKQRHDQAEAKIKQRQDEAKQRDKTTHSRPTEAKRRKTRRKR